MKVSLNWLSDYIETGLDDEKIVEVLGDSGFPCEGIEHFGDDTVLDVEVTSNRGDCLSLLGIARELAAATGKELKIPEVSPDESDKDVMELAGVEIAEPKLCPRYTARIIEGVKVGPSPDWLCKRVEAVGLRSVNNVVDATNYAMIETGQPPHAFDYDKIKDGKIIVRKAVSGERIVSIDGTTCDLNPDMLIIADPNGPVAVAGVMGGLDTEVSDTTTTILLEDAYFDPVSIRTTSRKLSLPSEASYRFERIVDIEKIDWASKRTAQLITQVAGGRVAKGVVDVYLERKTQKEVTLRLSRLSKLLGVQIPSEEVLRILSALSFQPQAKEDLIVCSLPSWRSDIEREVDLIEEVARVYGYNKIPTESKISIEVIPVDNRQKMIESIGKYLNGCGFYETINVGFVDSSIAGLFAASDVNKHLGVNDVTRKSANLLRQTLIGSLLTVLKTNVNAKNLPCRIFEIADTFVPADKKGVLPTEKTKLAMVCDSNLRDLRGVVEGLIKSVDTEAQTVFAPADLLWAQTGARIMVDDKEYGVAGIVGRAVKEKYDFTELSPCAAELDFELLLSLQRGDVKVKPIPRFPAIQRDLSIIVDEKVSWADIFEAVKARASNELENIQFVGIYRGEGIPSGKKSVTLSLRFRDEDGTLTHETVDTFQTDIVSNLDKSLGAQLRTV
ncbi:MAG: phenylalanine--tRNA ligase subunit beta [Phycisphaerae bacterium]|nr:phenylalanine--tRNA ligase subunit beta [Phycisphaerae bacterium]NIR66473.1 phenylalanine--tRNA ligase subunit beta [candidate division Zixibacteria bacterium]NIP56196.1 phenylalanine--tRNA ligase subunit beta [Phycisphaerae bacterium]NIS54658.1 phenylalanine--tRNA ligase subunit beta [Phycisphaerae bacterium]NIU11053.1 phenylalanine--tRNA ligase subunit beta [Phycisphaerae bacterium]